jgi:hypothetical protein
MTHPLDNRIVYAEMRLAILAAFHRLTPGRVTPEMVAAAEATLAELKAEKERTL